MNLFAGIILLDVVLAVLLIGVWWKKANLFALLVLGVACFFCVWTVAGMGLFVLDQFRLFRCACATGGLLLLTLAGAVLWRTKQDSTPLRQLVHISWDIQGYWIPLTICLAGLVLVCVKHGFFGMGQDQGVYQTVAINFMNGLTDRQQDFAEYHTLPESQQAQFRDYVYNRLYGYDIGSADYPETVYDLDVSPVSGIYHGIPTFASMLAMWGTLFGMSHMMHVQTVFYVLMICLTFLVCQNFQLRRSSCALACGLSAAAPAVIWVAKSSLTEMFLGVLLVLFLYFLTDQAHPQRQWLSILPVAVFGCYHVSIYTIVPLFVVLYGGMYWVTRRRCFAVLMPVTLAGYVVSFFAMRHVQPFYTMNNYSPLFGLGISQKDLPWLVPLAGGVGIVLCVAFCLILHRTVHRKYAHLDESKFLARVRDSRLGFILVEFLLVPLVLYIVLRCFIQEAPLTALRGSSLFGFACCLGIVPMVAAWAVAVLRPSFFLEQTNRLVLLVTVFYLVEIYSAFLRPEVQHFYYYGRYLVPFLPVVALFTAVTLDRLRARVTLPALAVGLAVVAPYDRMLSMEQDDTRLSFDHIEEIAQKIDEDDCVIVSSDNTFTLFLPIRAMTGAAVYPPVDDIPTLAKQLDAQYDKIYYLDTGSFSEEVRAEFEKVYENTVYTSQDYGTTWNATWLPLPVAYDHASYELCLYEYMGEQLTYTAAADAVDRFSGFGALENTFCWSESESALVRCALRSRDYTLTLQMGCMIDLKKLGMTQYPVTVLVNDEAVGTVTVDADNNGGTLSLDIPVSVLKEGQNIVTLRCALWDASQILAADTRQLGFPLASLTFTPKA